MRVVESTISSTKNYDGVESGEARVSSKALGKMMSMFSNQYSNGNLAVLREYFCNGDDARKEAGSTRPTEVTLPTDLQPSLLVRDFGIGLDKHGLTKVYTEYLESTKDDEDDSTGGFGIGSKSAYTLSPEFVTTGYKDGQMTTVRHYINDRGVSSWEVMHEGPTTEPNGVLVSVPIPDIQDMHETADVYFRTVDPATVLVDGKAPTHLFDLHEITRVNEQSVLVHDDEGEIRVTMGPVAYPVRREILIKVAKTLEDTDASTAALALVNWSSASSLYIDVPMGSLSLAPSREDLRDTKTTINTLAAAVVGINGSLADGVQAKVDAAPSRFAAMMLFDAEMEALKAFGLKRKQFTYQGVEHAFKADLEIPKDRNAAGLFLTTKTWRSTRKIVARDDTPSIDAARARNMLVVAGVPTDEFSKVSRYAKRFMEDAEPDTSFILVTPEASGSYEWLEWGTEHGVRTVDLAEYRQILRDSRESNPRLKREPSYTTGWTSAERDPDDRDLLSDILAEGKDIVVYHDNAYSDALTRKALEDYTVVVLFATQSEKAFRDRVAKEEADVKILTEHERKALVRVAAEDVFNSVTDDEKVAMAAATWLRGINRSDWTGMADRLGRENITSRRFLDWVDTIDLAVEYANALPTVRREEIQGALNHLGTSVDLPDLGLPTSVPGFDGMYPLLRHVYWYGERDGLARQHAIRYINSL